jgi:hypothetical protein
MKRFPLTLWAIEIGVFVAVFLGLLTYSFTVGFSVFVLFATVGATWRRDQAPIFPFILAFQWSAVTVGYFYYVATGIYPSAYATGDIDYTAFVSLLGLMVLASGIRLVSTLLPGPTINDPETGDPAMHVTNLKGLFRLVLLVFAVDYVYMINTKMFGGFDVILDRVLAFRYVLLLLLWFEVLRRKTQYSYLWFSLAWVFIPLLGSYFSDFKTPWILLLIAYMTYWRPWERGFWRFSLAQTVRVVAIAVVITFLALVWQAGVKSETRKVYDENLVSSNPLDRVSLFIDKAAVAVPLVFTETQTVVEGLIQRVSYITFFSRVLEYVPSTQAHTNGELLKMAVTNTVMPRFLFPEKPVLPSDSFYTRRFTGIMVAEEGTSISIGYMAEFYADWGTTGMFVSIFLYGCLMGLAGFVVRAAVKPAVFVNPVLIMALMVVYQFEHQFIKTFAALNISVLVLVGLSVLLRRRLARFLDLRPVATVADQATAPPVPARHRYRTLPRVAGRQVAGSQGRESQG